MALGHLPSDAELSELIERYAGSRRVNCEQADLFFASVGEAAPAKRSRSSGAPRDAAEVARGSWLDKLGSRSSAPPRGAAASSQPPGMSIAAVAALPPEEPITIEHGLEHLPATTYSSAPPPSALPTEDSAPVALPLSAHPAPQLAAADSVVVERWGMAETSPEPVLEREEPADQSQSAAEDELLERWSDDLDQAILRGESAAPARPASLPAVAAESERPAATDAPERWSAPHLSGESEHAAATDAPERWSAPQLGGELPAAAQAMPDEDAPLSAAELSLLEQWSAEDTSEPAPARSERAPAAETQRTRPALPHSGNGSIRPAPPSQPAGFAAHQTDTDAGPLDVELEDEIELEPDDLVEIDSE